MSANSEPTAHPDTPFTVGDWLVDPSANELHRDAATVRLEPKVMRVLCVLAERPGSVVAREDLESRVWAGMVVTSDAVTNTIIKLRKVFGDDSRHPSYIETLSKTGYRLIAEVGPGPTATPAPGNPGTWKARHPAKWLVPLLVALLLSLWLVWQEYGIEDVTPEQLPRVAVLPFENLSADPKQDYFADGITEDLITDLSKVSGLEVIARNSAFFYKGSREREKAIAADLGVAYLIKGSVRRSGDRIRINARLTDGRGGDNLWADRYDSRIDDVFDIQDEITTRIVAALEVEIAPKDRSRVGQRDTASVGAYDELLRGLDYFGRRSPESNRLAKQHYERAIELDPGFARAYAGLAMVYARDATDGWDSNAEIALSRASELAEKAQRLDPSLHQAYFVEGLLELFRGDYEAAIRSTEHAISIKPSYADAYALKAWIDHFDGRIAEGLANIEQAVRLNPRIPSVYRLLRGTLYYAQADLDQALADLEAAVEVNPNYQNLRIWLAAAYAAADRIDEAQWQSGEILALHPGFSASQSLWAFPIRDPAYRERFLGDLRRAGLPD
jgi:TolB-like protein/DNA-binding winged helix-turn-helix (wHTH) protein/Tfp pilus assembly protein PilF